MPYYTLYTLYLGVWHYGPTNCSVWMFFDYFATGISMWSLTVISVDRVWAVTWAISYRLHNKMSKSLALIATGWLITFFAMIFEYTKTRMYTAERLQSVNSTLDPEQCNWDVEGLPEWAAAINVVTVLIWIPSVVSVVSYIIIVAKIMQAKRTRSRVTVAPGGEIPVDSQEKKVPVSNKERKEKQAFLLLTLLICAIIGCWAPWYIYYVISFYTGIWNETANEATYWLAYSMSTINPFLLNVANNDIRLAIQDLFGYVSKKKQRRPGQAQVSTVSTSIRKRDTVED